MPSESKPLVLNLYGDRENFGGIVNLFNSLDPLLPHARFRQIHFRVGRRQADPRQGSLWSRGPDFIRNLFGFARTLKVLRPDVIHLNLSLNRPSIFRETAYVLIARFFGGEHRLLTFIHGWEIPISDRLGTFSATSFCVRLILSASCRIIVLGSRFREILVKHGIPARKIVVMATAVLVNRFRRSETAPGPDSDRLRFVFLSRIDRTKGLFELIDAFRVLKRRYPDKSLSLQLAGDGEDRGVLERLLEEDPQPGIRFSGYLRNEEKIAALHGADVFVLPTFFGEGCPVAILEAMAAGMPVITTRDGGIPDIIVHERNGLLVTKRSVEALTSALERCIQDRRWLQQTGKRNQQEAAEKYDLQIFLEKLEDQYGKVVYDHG